MSEGQTTEQTAARRKLRKLAADRKKAAAVEADTIAHALRLGVKQVEVMQDVERSREHIRQVARQAGIESSRPATAGRKKPDPRTTGQP